MTPPGSPAPLEAPHRTPTRSGGTGAARGSGPPSRIRGRDRSWRIGGGEIALDRPLVMGVVNLTPDSFFDGGRYRDVGHALEEAEAMVGAGAAIIDVGGESTRPGARPVDADEELDRILGFVEEGVSRLGVPISVDTRKAKVARGVLTAGAAVINDVSALSFDPEMGAVVADAAVGLVLMHMRGEPADMAEHASYDDVTTAVAAELSGAVGRARAAGVADAAIVVDPGIGFAKTARHSLELLARLGPILGLGFPVLVGPSRKSFIGAVTGEPPERRLPGTLAACVAAYLQGAQIFRVHDVEPVAHALSVAEAIVEARRWEPEGGRS